MAVHQCTRCELRFTNETELGDHMRREHDLDPADHGDQRYGGKERQQKPLYRDLVDDDE